MELMQAVPDGLQALRLGLLAELLLAGVLGGLIGWERERSDKPAGLRTNLLICIGATLIAHLSLHFAAAGHGADWIRADPGRIAAQIVSGIGFLGAGTILQARGSVTGLTTAATLWVVAAIGMAVGGGAYVAAVGATVLVLVTLLPLGWLEARIEARRPRSRSWRVVVDGADGSGDGVVDEVEEALRSAGLDPELEKVEWERERSALVIWVGSTGPEEAFDEARRRLLRREDLRELSARRAPAS